MWIRDLILIPTFERKKVYDYYYSGVALSFLHPSTPSASVGRASRHSQVGFCVISAF
jgi:hypothetical protein